MEEARGLSTVHAAAAADLETILNGPRDEHKVMFSYPCFKNTCRYKVSLIYKTEVVVHIHI